LKKRRVCFVNIVYTNTKIPELTTATRTTQPTQTWRVWRTMSPWFLSALLKQNDE